MHEVRLPKILFLTLEIASFYRNTFFNTNDLARLAERYASDLVRLRRDKTDYKFQDDTRAGGLRGNLSTLLTWQGFVKRGSKIVSTYTLGPDKRLVNAVCKGDIVLDRKNMTAHTNSETLRDLLAREARLLGIREEQAHIKQKLERTPAIPLKRVPDRFPKDSVVKSSTGQYYLRALLNNYVGSKGKVIQYSLVPLWEGKRFRSKNMHLLVVIPKEDDAWAEIYAVKSEELFNTKPMLLKVEVETKQCTDQHGNTYTLYPLEQAIREFSTEDENKQERLSHDWDALKTEYCEKDVAEEVRKEDEFSQFLRLFLAWRQGFKIDGKEVVDIASISSGGPDVELLYKGGTKERVELEHVWKSYLDHGHHTNSAFTGCWVFAEEKFDKDLIERLYGAHVEKHKDRLPSTFLCVENGEPKAWRIDWDTRVWNPVPLSFD